MEFDKAKIEWLEFDLLQSFPHVKHGVFLRSGGVSKEGCSSLNLGHGTSAHQENILANRELVRNQKYPFHKLRFLDME